MRKVTSAPGSPLRCDEVYAEYNIAIVPDRCWYIVFFCPFCGAKAPKSRREDYFTTVTKEEEARLLALASDCRTRADFIQRFGEPNWQHPAATGLDPVEQKPYAFLASILYTGLSATGDLCIQLNADDTIHKLAVRPRCLRPRADK